MQKLKLANRSRRNRRFYDSLIRELYFLLEHGITELNRDLILPSYNGPHGVITDECIQNPEDAWDFDTPRTMMPETMLDAIDQMLRDAPSLLKGCGNRKIITDYLNSRTDFNSCHFTALNACTEL